MSEYLMIKKNGVDIACWCRSSYEFQALSDYAPFDEWKIFNSDVFNTGIEWLRDKRDAYAQDISDMEKLITNLHYEDALQCMQDTKEIRVEYDAVNSALNTLQVIKNVCDEPVYSRDDYDTTIPITLEWCRG